MPKQEFFQKLQAQKASDMKSRLPAFDASKLNYKNWITV